MYVLTNNKLTFYFSPQFSLVLGFTLRGRECDIGLVKYTLYHGQPINSVLDGVLCLHAASSEGYELVVKLLIEQGVDVNASG